MEGEKQVINQPDESRPTPSEEQVKYAKRLCDSSYDVAAEIIAARDSAQEKHFADVLSTAIDLANGLHKQEVAVLKKSQLELARLLGDIQEGISRDGFCAWSPAEMKAWTKAVGEAMEVKS